MHRVEDRHDAPFLIFSRSGKTIAAVLAFGFGGGTVLLGVVSALSAAFTAHAAFSALRGYLLAALPFFVAAAVLARCRRELWFVPDARAFRMLTFRPWLLSGPRVEEAPLHEYRGLRTETLRHTAEQQTTVVSLVTEGGDAVPVRQLDRPEEASAFAEELASITGLVLQADRGAAE
jgi:hypothetical protein